jgi:hypothetical protein
MAKLDDASHDPLLPDDRNNTSSISIIPGDDKAIGFNSARPNLTTSAA